MGPTFKDYLIEWHFVRASHGKGRYHDKMVHTFIFPCKFEVPTKGPNLYHLIYLYTFIILFIISFIIYIYIFHFLPVWYVNKLFPQDYIVHPTLEQWKLSHKLKLKCYCIKCERLSSCALCCTAHLWENMYQQNISKIVTKFWQVTGFWHRNI